MGMDVFQTTEELVGKHQDCFQRELATTEVEKVFETRTQQVKHHGVVFALSFVRVDSWNTRTTSKRSIDLSFTFEERRIDGYMFKFDGDLVTGVNIGCLSAVSEYPEAAVTRRIYHYLCIQRRNYHHRSCFAAEICRPHVDPDF